MKYRSCILIAFSRATGVPEDEIIRLAGHDGNEVVFPKEVWPQTLRGFHIQELLLIGAQLGHFFEPFEFCPVTASPRGLSFYIPDEHVRLPYLADKLRTTVGFISGVRKFSGIPHAISYQEGTIQDMDRSYPFVSWECFPKNGFYPERMWMKL